MANLSSSKSFQINGDKTTAKVSSPTTLAKVKRRVDGAARRVENAKATIAALKDKRKAKSLRLTQRRHIHNQILKAEKALVQARQDYKEYDQEFREAAHVVVKHQRNELAGLRYEARELPTFKEEFVPRIENLMMTSAANNTMNAVERQMELVELASSDKRAQFNKKFGELLKDLDTKLFINVDRTKILKRKLQASMLTFFQKKHDQLPQNSFEEDEFRRNNEKVDVETEVENEPQI